ncbi:AAA family ATPase [Dermatobacter hominis]|uniref:AAA family ATPase n=1 Tax=Dermatobacter hominis TaxID=2884263 RepID=UPI001D0F8935|nr:AAA family ATPase [Dermatobacter hominis]UDY35843.1 AAA family ATPase [Dermatobacter hominis]
MHTSDSDLLDSGSASSLLIVTGPPGAGKTTVARDLARREPGASVCVESDWFWTTIVRGPIEPWLPEADTQNRAVLAAAASAAAALRAGGYATALEGIIGPWMLDTLSAVIGPNPIDYVVLRPDLSTCLHRARTRSTEPRVSGHPPLSNPEPIRQMWEQFQLLGQLEHHVVDTTGLDADQTTDAIIQDRVVGRFRLSRITAD